MSAMQQNRNVKVVVGDLFKSRAQTLVNTVNCVGVMGKGVALGFKERFPDMFEDYVRRCERREVRLGRPYLYKGETEPWVLNFPTKDHWRSVARLDAIVEGLEHLERNYRDWGITSLAVPPLGCGEGQLEWGVVGPTLYRHLDRLLIPVELYGPYGTPHEELEYSFLERSLPGFEAGGDSTSIPESFRVTAGEVALVAILAQVQKSRYRTAIGRTTFQKLAYFATRSGIPTGLTFERGSYGPWAGGLKRMTARLTNNGLIEERQLGRMHAVEVGPTFEDARKLYAEQLHEWKPHLDRVADLLARFLTTKRAEAAATVHFAAEELLSQRGRSAESDVLDEVMRWKVRRRPPLDENEIARTIRMLGVLEWIDLTPTDDLLPEDDVLLDV